MVIDVEREWEAVGEEDTGEEIEVGEECLGGVKTRAGVGAGGVVEDVEEDLLVRLVRQPGVGRGIVLPERAEVAGLPAADGLPGLLVTGVRGVVVSESPTADAGTVGLEGEAAQEFAGDGAVGGTGRAREQARGEGNGFCRPVRMMIAPRSARFPLLRPDGRARPEVIGAELVEATEAYAQLGGYLCGRKPARAGLCEKMADEGRSEAAGQLRFFIAPVVAGGWILRILADAGQG